MKYDIILPPQSSTIYLVPIGKLVRLELLKLVSCLVRTVFKLLQYSDADSGSSAMSIWSLTIPALKDTKLVELSHKNIFCVFFFKPIVLLLLQVCFCFVMKENLGCLFLTIIKQLLLKLLTLPQDI